jgi:hypothetical protein
MTQLRAYTGITLASLGCAGPATLPGAAATAPLESRQPAATSSSAGAPPHVDTSGSSRVPAPCSADTPATALAEAKFSKLHSGPVLSAAVGKPPRAAIWSGTSVTLFQGEQARELPAPQLPAGAVVELFFGRDDQPRLMGFAPGEPGREVPVYLRFRQGVFRPEPSELGPLGAPRGALYGVLGFDDPEVVCRPRELCLVKRTTGWARVAAHAEPARVVLRDGSVFALHADRIERLEKDGWSVLEPARAFERPLDVWLAQNGELWVTDHSAHGLTRLTRGRWEAVSSPVNSPRAVFGRSERSVFVVGANGAAVFDGYHFRCVGDVLGPLHLAFPVGDAIWLAGESGVYRSVQ